MKNSDLPAMPSGVLQDRHNCGNYPLHAGLTKREMFAMTAMQGLCTAMLDNDARDFVIFRAKELDCEPKNALAKISVQYADALLAELERTK